jgi:hypothetical protein
MQRFLPKSRRDLLCSLPSLASRAKFDESGKNNGPNELIGGTADDHAAARKWCSQFAPAVVFTSAPVVASPAPDLDCLVRIKIRFRLSPSHFVCYRSHRAEGRKVQPMTIT